MMRGSRYGVFRDRSDGRVGAGRVFRAAQLLVTLLGLIAAGLIVGEARADAPTTPAIRILVVKTEAEARDALARANSGVAFDQIVRERSIGPERGRGGYLGRVDPAGLPPSIRGVLARTRSGRLSAVFETEGGFGVLQVLTDQEEKEAEARLRQEPEARDLLKRGTDLGRQGDIEGAVALLTRAIELDPGLGDAHFNLGIGLYRLGRREDAIREMQEAVRLQPSDFDAHMRLGAWLSAAGQLGEAVAEFERATALRMESLDAWLRLAQAYDAAGRGRAAVEAYRRVLGLLGRDDPLILEALLKAATQAKDGPTAVEVARKLLARRSDHEGFLALGDALMLNGESEAAIREYQKAVALAPNSARGHARLGAAYAQANQFEPAAEQLLRAVRLEPDQLEYYQVLSRLYEQMGRLDLAIVSLRDGVGVASNAPRPIQAEIAERLASLYGQAGMSREAETEQLRAKILRTP
jgi:tetratricopeptide (TPR) repeat protein